MDGAESPVLTLRRTLHMLHAAPLGIDALMYLQGRGMERIEVGRSMYPLLRPELSAACDWRADPRSVCNVLGNRSPSRR